MNDPTFWGRYFQSKLFNRHRSSARQPGDAVKPDDIFDKYLEDDDDGIVPKNLKVHEVYKLLDLAATEEDHVEVSLVVRLRVPEYAIHVFFLLRLVILMIGLCELVSNDHRYRSCEDSTNILSVSSTQRCENLFQPHLSAKHRRLMTGLQWKGTSQASHWGDRWRRRRLAQLLRGHRTGRFNDHEGVRPDRS